MERTFDLVGRVLTSEPRERSSPLFVGIKIGEKEPGAYPCSIFTCHDPSANGPVVTGEPEPRIQLSAQI